MARHSSAALRAAQPRSWRRVARLGATALFSFSTWLAVVAGEPPAKPDGAPVVLSLKFDSTGAMPGEQLPELALRTLKDEPQELKDAWYSRPALLVACSFTSPESRSHWPEAKAIAKKYQNKLNVVIVYVIEAHPSGDISPYKGVEDVTEENRRDRILRRQPKLLADRIELAQAFKSRMNVTVPIYVDTMDNLAWKAMGGGPNTGVLVRSGGAVEFRQGWFDGKTMTKAIDEYFAKQKESLKASKTPDPRKENESLRIPRMRDNELRDIFQDRDLSKARDLINQYPDLVKYVSHPSPPHQYTATMLGEAARVGNIEMMQMLLDHGADVNAPRGLTLSDAAARGNLKIIQWLLAHKAIATQSGTPGTLAPLHIAVLHAHPEVAQALIDAGAKPDFFIDVGLGKTDAVASALKADRSRAYRPDSENNSPLMYAAANGQIEVAKALLAADGGRLEHAKSARQKPSLHYAIEHGDAAMTKLLLDARLPPDTVVHRGEGMHSGTALHLAVSKDSTELIQILLDHHADIEARDGRALTPLQFAVSSGSTKVVEALLQAKADPNAVQLGYETPCGNEDRNHPTLDTSLHIAAREGKVSMIELLIAGGARIDALNALGNTPLMAAIPSEEPGSGYYDKATEARQKRANCAERLLAHNAERGVVNKAGKTANELAQESKDPFLLKALGLGPAAAP